MAIGALVNDASAPIMHMRTMNTYVAAAITDWHKTARLSARMPRQCGSAFLNRNHNTKATLASTSSFGMSGVNAHMLLDAPSSDDNESRVCSCSWRSIPRDLAIALHKKPAHVSLKNHIILVTIKKWTQITKNEILFVP